VGVIGTLPSWLHVMTRLLCRLPWVICCCNCSCTTCSSFSATPGVSEQGPRDTVTGPQQWPSSRALSTWGTHAVQVPYAPGANNQTPELKDVLLQNARCSRDTLAEEVEGLRSQATNEHGEAVSRHAVAEAAIRLADQSKAKAEAQLQDALTKARQAHQQLTECTTDADTRAAVRPHLCCSKEAMGSVASWTACV
jgi:hypothetical protein